MALPGRQEKTPTPAIGMAISICIMGLASLSGGLAAAVTLAGRAMPTSASLFWISILLVGSLLLALWGLLFARLLHHRANLSPERALYLAALCHLPLLLSLAPVGAVYSNDVANFVYSSSVYGQVVFRPMVLAWLFLGPALAQAVVAGTCARRRVARFLPLLGAVMVALILRVWSLDWQLPFLLHNDERTYLGIAMMSWAHGDPNPHRFYNPSLVFYIDTALFNLIGGGAFENFRVFASAFGRQVSDPRGIYLVALAARGVSALLGTATIPAVYVAAKELFGRRAAILAAWLMAVAFLHVRNSHYGTNDVDATFFTTASFLFAVRIYRLGRWRDYLWAGVMGGLATTTKYNAGIFILPILVAHLARTRKVGLRAAVAPRGLAPLVASYAVSGVVFVLGTPYSLLDWDSFTSGFLRQAAYGSSPWWGQDRLPTWWMHVATLFQGFGVVPLLLAALGAVALARSAPSRLALVAAFPAGYFAFMAGQQLHFARFTIPMLPFLAILAGQGLDSLAARACPASRARLVIALLAVVAMAQPLVYSVQGDLLMGREDTRVSADRWMTANLPTGSILLVDELADLRESQGWPSSQDLRIRWFKPTVDPTPWQQEEARPVYLITTSFGYEGMLRSEMSAMAPRVYQEMERQGHLVAYFPEGLHGQSVGYSQDDTYTPFWHLWDRATTGPTVLIYRFD